MAANEPSAIDAIEMKTMICCHCTEDAREGIDEDARRHRHAGHLGRGGEERRHRRRRALVDVRRPHVERHGRDLEGDAGGDEDEAEDDADAAALPCKVAAMVGKETLPVKP